MCSVRHGASGSLVTPTRTPADHSPPPWPCHAMGSPATRSAWPWRRAHRATEAAGPCHPAPGVAWSRRPAQEQITRRPHGPAMRHEAPQRIRRGHGAARRRTNKQQDHATRGGSVDGDHVRHAFGGEDLVFAEEDRYHNSASPSEDGTRPSRNTSGRGGQSCQDFFATGIGQGGESSLPFLGTAFPSNSQ